VWGESFYQSEQGRKQQRELRAQRDAQREEAARVLREKTEERARKKEAKDAAKAEKKRAKKAAAKARKARKVQEAGQLPEAAAIAVVMEGPENISERGIEEQQGREAQLASVGGDNYLLTRPEFDQDADTGADLRPQSEQWAEFQAQKAAFAKWAEAQEARYRRSPVPAAPTPEPTPQALPAPVPRRSAPARKRRTKTRPRFPPQRIEPRSQRKRGVAAATLIRTSVDHQR
jgi:hypothetical protein